MATNPFQSELNKMLRGVVGDKQTFSSNKAARSTRLLTDRYYDHFPEILY